VKTTQHTNDQNRADDPSRVCPVEGCQVVLGAMNASGVCRHHLHGAMCKCASCSGDVVADAHTSRMTEARRSNAVPVKLPPFPWGEGDHELA
jgi:hypothetical protein